MTKKTFEIGNCPIYGKIETGIWEIFHHPHNSETAIWEIYDLIRNEMKVTPSKWYKYFDWLSAYDNIFIDDAFDQTKYYETYDYFFYYLTMLAYAETYCPEKLIWIAVDPYGDFIKTNAVIYRLLIPPRPGDLPLLTFLKEVTRCSENVFDSVMDVNVRKHGFSACLNQYIKKKTLSVRTIHYVASHR